MPEASSPGSGAGLPKLKSAETPNRVQSFGPSDQFAGNLRLTPSQVGVLDVAMHGTSDAVYLKGHNPARPAQLGDLIRGKPVFAEQPVRFISCHTGADAGGFAQQLADRLGAPVSAPTDLVWAHGDWALTIGPAHDVISGG